ncbi:MAG: hypothetical protein LVQ96_06670 [Thermoplasmatales archaeon]|nr:hypothetical protein [Thermoplasmatales archaeon]
MKPFFTLEYSEFEFADTLSKSFDKDKYSVVIPTSRQQKYFDVALLNIETRKSVTFQIKSSRSYDTSPSDQKKYKVEFHGWFSKPVKIDQHLDFLVLTVYFPFIPKGEKGENSRISIDTKIFLFRREEVEQYNMNKKQFYIGKHKESEYYVCRSVDSPKQINKNIYDNWINSFKNDRSFHNSV